MNWINSFELMCYSICALSVADMLSKKDVHMLMVFLSAALVGYIMEMLAVRVTDIYYYSDLYWFSLGTSPYQFPFFGGLMWGGLTVHGIRLAEKLKMNPLLTALAAGMLIVSMDLFLDVAAIRLDGGFWVWAGRDINLNIDQHMLMSVIWVNFVGYLIETPTVAWMALKLKNKKTNVKQNLQSAVIIALKALIVTSIGSLAALGLNALSDDWFSCLAFVSVWIYLAMKMVHRASSMKLSKINKWDWMSLIFYLAMYIYNIIALISLQIPLWYILFCIICMGFTMWLACAEHREENI